MASECSFEVSDDAVQETKSVDHIFKELNCLLSCSQNNLFVFNPLGELVDGNVHILETTWHWLERADHV